jgi:hypothetical protein
MSMVQNTNWRNVHSLLTIENQHAICMLYKREHLLVTLHVKPLIL